VPTSNRLQGREFRPRRGPDAERGATIVEFALVFPLFLLLCFAIIDFGHYFFVQHTLQFATREGVRLALVGRTIDDGSGNRLSRIDSIVKTIRDKASIAVKPSDLEISVYPVPADFSDPAGWETTQNAGPPGSFMRVKTRYKFRFPVPLISAVIPGGQLKIQAQATYMNELFF
jgi:hypothetical protein